MESYPLPHYDSIIYIALFEKLANAAALRQRLIAASQLPDDDESNEERSRVDFAFVDASMLTSRLHLLTAINQALLARSEGTLRTKTIHSEILWQLEPGTNISDSLKHFGVSATSTALALVHVAPLNGATRDSERSVLERMQSLSGGNPSSLDLLGRLPDGGTNEKSLRKIYKLNSEPVLKNVEPASERERQILDQLCIASVALKVVTRIRAFVVSRTFALSDSRRCTRDTKTTSEA